MSHSFQQALPLPRAPAWLCGMQTWAMRHADLAVWDADLGLLIWGHAPWILAPPALAPHRAVKSQMPAGSNIWPKPHPQHNLTLQTPHSAASTSRSLRNHPVSSRPVLHWNICVLEVYASSEGTEILKRGVSCRKRLWSHFSPPVSQHKAVVRHQQKLDSNCAEHSMGPLLP